jgi:hypothetical protein
MTVYRSPFAIGTVTYLGARGGAVLEACATNRKVAGSIPDGVIGIFHQHNLSGLTTAMELT